MEQLPREVLVAIDRVLSPEGSSFQAESPDVCESLNALFPDGQPPLKQRCSI